MKNGEIDWSLDDSAAGIQCWDLSSVVVLVICL